MDKQTEEQIKKLLDKVDEAFKEKKYTEALRDIKNIFDIDENNINAYILEIYIYASAKQYDKCINSYKKAFNSNSKNDTFISHLTTIFINCIIDKESISINNTDIDSIINNIVKDTSSDTNNDKVKIKKLQIYEHMLLYFLRLKMLSSTEEISTYMSLDLLDILIIKNNKSISKLRMGTISKVNDPEEGKTLLKMLNDNIEESDDIQENKNIKENKCVTVQRSFTRCKDSLTMFRLYGKKNGLEGSGACLVFNKNFFDTDLINNTPNSKTNIECDVFVDTDKKTLPLYHVLYYDENTNELIFNPNKSNYKNIIIDLKNTYEFEYMKRLSFYIIRKNEDEDYYNKILINNIGYIFNKIFDTIDFLDNKENGYNALMNIKYLIKNKAYVEEQELRILKILDYDEVDIDKDDRSVYKDYLEVIFNNSLKEIILGPKIENVEAVKEMYTAYIKQQSEDDRYKDIKVSISKAPFN